MLDTKAARAMQVINCAAWHGQQRRKDVARRDSMAASRRTPMKTSKKSPKNRKNGRLPRAMGPHLPPARTPSGAPAPGPLAPPPAPDTATRQEPTQRAGRDLVTPLADRALHHWLGSAGVLRGCIWELKFCRRHARDVERDLAVLSCSLSCCTTFVRTFSLHAMRRRQTADNARPLYL